MDKGIYSIKDITEMFKKEMLELRNGEKLRIVSGEANWKIFNNPELEESFRYAKLMKDISICMIAGPILSIENRDKLNSIIRLAEDGIIKLFISDQRREHHFRIYGMRKLWQEGYHPPLADERHGYYITDEIPFGLIVIGKYISDFDNVISMELAKRSVKPREDFILLTSEQINDLRQAIGNDYNFDLLNKDKVKSILANKLCGKDFIRH